MIGPIVDSHWVRWKPFGKIKDYLDEGFTLAAAAQKVTGTDISNKEGQTTCIT